MPRVPTPDACGFARSYADAGAALPDLRSPYADDVVATPAAGPAPDGSPPDAPDDVPVDGPVEVPVAPGRPVPGWVGLLFLTLAVVTVPWIALLWVRLPARDLAGHYRLAWVGFDILLAAALARTGWTAWRGVDHVQLPAVASATLLVVDAWFDVTTASSRAAVGFAVASALLVELPLAGLCVWIAVNAERVRRERLRWALDVDPRQVQH